MKTKIIVNIGLGIATLLFIFGLGVALSSGSIDSMFSISISSAALILAFGCAYQVQ